MKREEIGHERLLRSLKEVPSSQVLLALVYDDESTVIGRLSDRAADLGVSSEELAKRYILEGLKG